MITLLNMTLKGCLGRLKYSCSISTTESVSDGASVSLIDLAPLFSAT